MTCRYKCKDGFEPISTVQVTTKCEWNGAWAPVLPALDDTYCVRSACTAKPAAAADPASNLVTIEYEGGDVAVDTEVRSCYLKLLITKLKMGFLLFTERQICV